MHKKISIIKNLFCTKEIMPARAGMIKNKIIY